MKHKRIAFVALVSAFGVYFLNFLAGKMSWYWIMWWFDMPMHFFGGFLSAVLIFLFFYKKLRALDSLHTRRTFLFIMLGILALGLVWELHEVIVERAIPAGMDIVSFVDSISDLFFDMAGGLLAYLLVWRRKSPNESR